MVVLIALACSPHYRIRPDGSIPVDFEGHGSYAYYTSPAWNTEVTITYNGLTLSTTTDMQGHFTLEGFTYRKGDRAYRYVNDVLHRVAADPETYEDCDDVVPQPGENHWDFVMTPKNHCPEVKWPKDVPRTGPEGFPYPLR